MKSGELVELRTSLPTGTRYGDFGWSPDGGKLTFSGTRGGEVELWLISDFLTALVLPLISRSDPLSPDSGSFARKCFRAAPSRPIDGTLERELGYRFRDPDLLREALSHRSFIGVRGENRLESNERLEFLGDSILDLVVAHELFRHYPLKSEGDLTELKSLLVSRPTLARIARDLGLGEALLLSKNEESTGGRTRPSILADAFEALLGALYLDGGYESCERVIRHICDPYIAGLPDANELKDPKTRLQEWLQGRAYPLPEYNVLSESGPPHKKHFLIQLISA